jgi:hypothetical protein
MLVGDGVQGRFISTVAFSSRETMVHCTSEGEMRSAGMVAIPGTAELTR